MNSETQLKIQAYLDNELSAGEARQIAALLSGDSTARDLYTELQQTKRLVCENEPVVRIGETREFYWSKIQREISRTEQAPRPRISPWWVRFLAPAAGAAALFALLLSIVGPGPGVQPVGNRTELRGEPAVPMHQSEVVSPEMSAITFRSESEGMTVVWVSARASEPATILDWLE